MLQRFLKILFSAGIITALCFLISLVAAYAEDFYALPAYGLPATFTAIVLQPLGWLAVLTVIGSLWGEGRVWIAIGQTLAATLICMFAHRDAGLAGLTFPMLYLPQITAAYWPALAPCLVALPLLLKASGELDRPGYEPQPDDMQPYNRLW